MRARCLNPKHKFYADYGGRGVTICEAWSDFEVFYRDFGHSRPASGFSIDRVNNNGNYEPGNVRWATARHLPKDQYDALVKLRETTEYPA